MNAEQWQQAIDLLETNHRLVKSDYELSWNLGWAYFRSERFSKAVAPLKNAVRLEPQRWGGHWALASAYLQLNRLDEAIESSKSALELKDATIARQTLALSYMKLGNIAAAEAVHRRGLELQPLSAQR